MPRMMNFRPLGTRILVSPCIEQTQETAIILPEAAQKKEPPTGVVLSKGRGDKFLDLSDVIVGSTWKFKRGSGTPVKVGRAKCLILEYSDLLFAI